MADSRVQKAIVSLVALKKRKRLSQFRDETRSSLALLLHALKRRQRPAASYSGMSKFSTLKRGASILLIRFFFAVPFPLFLILSLFILYFCPSFFNLFMTSLTVNSLPLDWSCTWYTKRQLIRPRPHVSGDFCIRKFFYVYTPNIHTCPPYTLGVSGDFGIRWRHTIKTSLFPR